MKVYMMTSTTDDELNNAQEVTSSKESWDERSQGVLTNTKYVMMACDQEDLRAKGKKQWNDDKKILN